MAKKPVTLDKEPTTAATLFVNPVMRFVCRPSNDRKGAPPDLVLGACFTGQTRLKAGRVYELQTVLGETRVVDKGPAAIGSRISSKYKPEDGGSVLDAAWDSGAAHLMGVLGKDLYLTVDEYAKQCKARRASP